MSPGQQPLLQTLFNQRLTTTPCVRIHLDRIPRYLVQTPRVAVLGYSCELGLHLLHVRFHGDDRFGRVEKTAVARTHERPQLLSIVVGIGAELLFKLANRRDRVLESVFPRLESPWVRRVSRHGHR
jgi:hypothetical protein